MKRSSSSLRPPLCKAHGRPSSSPAHSSFILHPSSFPPSRRALGVIELLALVAILAVAFALMAATARHVRSNSAMELTRKRMTALTQAAADLIKAGGDPGTPITFPSTTTADEKLEGQLRRFAAESSKKLGDALAKRPGSILSGSILAGDTPELRDAWGRPMALFPAQFSAVGMAPEDRAFLVSAGPDGRFLTLADNIYSYDLPVLLPPRANPATKPALANATASEPDRPTGRSTAPKEQVSGTGP